MKIAIIFCVLPMYCSCVAYIGRVESDYNPKLVNMSVNYTHDARGHSLTLLNHVTITKFLIYVGLLVAENDNDREYKRKLVNSVIDIEKAVKGFQSSIWIKGYADSILKCMDFEFKLSLRPVSKNRKINTSH